MSEIYRNESSNNKKCVCCKLQIRKISGQKKIITTDSEAVYFSQILKKTVSVSDELCPKCRSKLYKAVSYSKLKSIPEPITSTASVMETSEEETESSTSDVQSSSSVSQFDYVESEKEEIEYVEVPINRVIVAHKYCFICSGKTNIVMLSLEGRLHVFMRKQIFIPKGNRCCRNLLIKGRLYDDDLDKLRIHCSRNRKNEIATFLQQLPAKAGKSVHDKIRDCTLSEEQLKIFTGFTYDELDVIQNKLSSMRNSEGRSVFQALVAFLFKFRTGNSNKLVASVLGLPSEQCISDYSESVINSFEKDVLATEFGINKETRQNIIENHTSPYVRKLFGFENKLVLIYDGTYVRHQKSANNTYQRKSYSVHKKASLCKPFTVCATDGFVVDVAGPFNANKNDAEILKEILRDDTGLSSILRKGDVFVLDRGFRDIKVDLEKRGYIVLMPSLKGKRSQLTAEESNQSRLVTKLRWVVEAIHGIIGKKYKLLHNQLDNKMLPRVRTYCRIACFLNNYFGHRLNADTELFEEIATEILEKKTSENQLAVIIENESLRRRKKPFQIITSADIHDFPEMTHKDLKILFTGTYQLTQAISYLAEMVKEDGTVDLSFVKENQEIVKFLVRSRHINSKTYKCYVNYKANSTGRAGILGYMCECANGLRTIGTCSHIAAVIYYLSNARYQSRIVRPSEILSKLFEYEKVEAVINDDSDED